MYYGHGYGYGKAKKAGGFDPLAATYFAAVPNAYSASYKTAINNLIAGLRSDGNLTKLDRLWLFANTTTGNAVIDVIGLNSATLVNAPTFTADQGYQGNASTSYVNTNFTPSTHGVNFTLNSCSIGFYCRTEQTGLYLDMEARDASSWIGLHARFFGDTSYADNDVTYGSVTTASSLGFFATERTASNAKKALKNGVSISTATTASISLPTRPIFVGGGNNDGSLQFPDSKQFSIAFIGSGTMDHSALYTRIQTYMTSLGTQV